jgi:hypothetical protein
VFYFQPAAKREIPFGHCKNGRFYSALLLRSVPSEKSDKTIGSYRLNAFDQLRYGGGVCDALRLFSGPLSALRGASAPSRNNLSHANKHRDAALAERLFWSVLDHLQKLSPGFATGRQGQGLARRFRRVIHVVDSTTIALIASCRSALKS